MNDEINLVDYIRIIKKQKVIILCVIAVGIGIALFSPVKKKSFYRATGHYTTSNPNPTQFIIVERIKNPSLSIAGKKDTSVVTLKTIASTAEEAEAKLKGIAEGLDVTEIVDISSEKVIKGTDNRYLIIILSIFVALGAGFLKEWFEKNWREI